MAASIAEIIILCLIADWFFRRMRIPGLIGMLLVGVLLGPYVFGILDPNLLAIGPDLRLIALIVILLRVGFELSRSTLHRIGGRALLLAFIPATIEGAAITLAGPWLLGLTLLESAILGSVLAAVSPAVIVPAMIRFTKERRGAAKDIPSMVMASASVDDVYVIVAHSAILGIYIGGSVNLLARIASVPLSLTLGIAAGLGVGVVLYKLFDRFNPRATKRVLILIALSILLVRLQHVIADILPFAGLVSAMAIGFIILEKREGMAHELSAKLAKTWIFAEIILFAMIGAEVNIAIAWQAGAMGAAIIAVGLLARSLGVGLCLLGSRLNLKERLFVAVAFSPKATVQAAIGSAPLLAMRSAGMDTGPGELILAIAVLSIFLTAPAGAWAINALGRRVLEVAPESEHAAYDAAVASS
ncbi:MAG TPA: cation:proton antiporter [Kiritimatiellia bacterium]|mgnify:CR=1 FL=1|nr:cation:proton antiporter [Kiritimatiellia bacterium]